MLTQLETGYLSRFNGRHNSRTLKQFRVRTHRITKTRIRKTRSAYLAWHRRQYFPVTAYNEANIAIRRNEDICIAITVIAIALGYAYATIAAELSYTFFLTAFLFSEASGINMLIISMIATISLAITFAWVVAFILNSMSLAIMQGANRKKIRSTRSTMRQALSSVGRTITSWLLLLTAVAAPVIAVGIIGAIHFLLSVNSPSEAIKIVPFYSIAAAAAAIYVLMQYSLAPFVVLFETSLTYKEVFKRSKQLTVRKGKLFILAIFLALAAILSVEFALSVILENLIGLNKGLAFSLMAIATVGCVNGVMTMFYRKRRMARTNTCPKSV